MTRFRTVKAQLSRQSAGESQRKNRKIVKNCSVTIANPISIKEQHHYVFETIGYRAGEGGGEAHVRPKTAATKAAEVKRLFKKGLSNSEIARRPGISRTSVIRILNGA